MFSGKKQYLPIKINVLSSNYTLYADLSNRLMTVLGTLAPRLEVYSIDEAFMDVSGIECSTDYEAFGQQVRSEVRAATGLTVGVGIGPTKTLAKSAQSSSKEWPQFKGVLAVTTRARAEKMLLRQPVEEIWGVGGRIAKRLKAMGIETALDLSRANLAMIRRQFSVALERTVRELNGESCISLEDVPPVNNRSSARGHLE